MAGPRRLLLVAIDAGEPSLVERWTADGTLPNLRSLRQEASYGRLQSPADWLVGSIWPTFYAGTLPVEHGFYHYLAWDPDRMRSVRPDAAGLRAEPFWRRLTRSGKQVVVLDVPLAPIPSADDGVSINGWGTHERLADSVTYSTPELARWTERHFGPPPFEAERHRRLPIRMLVALRDSLVRQTDRVGDLACRLMARQPWDLFLVCFTATHRGGHKLWDETGVMGSTSEAQRAELQNSLRDVYRAVDRQIGRLIERAGDDTTILAFSLHGMGPNTCHTDLLQEMLGRVIRDVPVQGTAGPDDGSRLGGRARRLLERARGAVPEALRAEVKRRLPNGLQDALTSFWRTGGYDWARTLAVSLPADLQGYIRVNLAGREAEGVVEPGVAHEQLLSKIAEGLQTFVDADTGEPIVHGIARPAELFGEGPGLDNLPDLLVRWRPTPAASRRLVSSARFGSVAWPTPGANPSGRSGNHRPEGFLIAAGDPFPSGERLEDAHIVDLAPTVLGFFGLPAPDRMRGRSLLSNAPALDA